MISVIGMSMYIGICTFSFTCTCVLVYVRALWCMHTHLFIPTLMPSHVQGCVCTGMCAFTMVPVLSYVVIYVFISLFIYIYVYIFWYTCVQMYIHAGLYIHVGVCHTRCWMPVSISLVGAVIFCLCPSYHFVPVLLYQCTRCVWLRVLTHLCVRIFV